MRFVFQIMIMTLKIASNPHYHIKLIVNSYEVLKNLHPEIAEEIVDDWNNIEPSNIFESLGSSAADAFESLNNVDRVLALYKEIIDCNSNVQGLQERLSASSHRIKDKNTE